MGKRAFFEFGLALATVTTIGAGVCQAQVTKEDAACRAAVAKNAAKLATTAMKAVDTCVASVLKGKRPATDDCNDVATADSPKGKVTKAAEKLAAGIDAKCSAASNAAALAAFANCPSPGDATDAGGATEGIDDFTELENCQVELNTALVESLRGAILVPDASAILPRSDAKTIAKCVSAIAKGATKLWGTIAKERGKCQKASDSGGGSYDYGCSTSDPSGKISKMETKVQGMIQKACGDSGLTQQELVMLGSCGTGVSDIGACVSKAVRKSAGGLTASAFAFAGICPARVALAVRGGARNGDTGAHTSVDLGWKGFGHDTDLSEGFRTGLVVSCGNTDCETCLVGPTCDEGNCRCANDSSIHCDTPGAAGGPCGADICALYLGPPRHTNPANLPLCTLEKIETGFLGGIDVGTGWTQLGIDALPVIVNEWIHLGIDNFQPCPVCSGAAVGQSGTCSGGARNGLACTTDGVDRTFGNVSYDCPPHDGTLLDASRNMGMILTTDSAVSLAFDDLCEDGVSQCACGACSGDVSVGCINDDHCAGMGLGTCTSTSQPRRPNACDDGVCSADPSGGPGEGICNAGPTDLFCDGMTRANGDGYLACIDQADCDAFGAGAGSCTIGKKRDCYLNPITATGQAGSTTVELVATYCSGQSSSATLNATLGLPGAGRTRLQADVTSYCSDGVTEYELGGANCP